ncbi:hypothetical protein [Nonomuraea sp. NPDC048901]|uniref:hypothetical protein n=1 Tax=Nonomuraea sp. NPDC048901 TaxID=3155627 RepID=UPI0033E1F321
MMPEENNYRYCKVFTTAPEVAVKALLVELLGGEFDRHTMDLTSWQKLSARYGRQDTRP